ncbi:MAG: phosphonoacetaldehyde reductase [Hyphomicrobiales bacterium]|nr:phosphonoacetaldehyde reductase [Hyphomicrobiales bacterium]
MWTFENPVNITFGIGALNAIAGIVAGRPCCLVTYDEKYFSELAASLISSIGEPQSVINNITPNPDFETLRDNCQTFANSVSADTVIIALGGGSVIDTAKVLASTDKGFEPVQQFLETGENETRLASYPIIAVPTTAGTGSEVTRWATVWDGKSQKKYSLARPSLYPTHAVIDPALTRSLPRQMTIYTALDALSHSLESLWNRNANPVSSNYAVYAASQVISALPLLVDDLENIGLRTRISKACLFAGLAFSNTKTALAHSLSYPITLKYGIIHGLACSFSLPKIMASVIGQDSACDQNLKRIFGPDLDTGVNNLEQFLAGLGVSTRASSYGVQKDEWQGMLTNALAGERGLNFIGSSEKVLEMLILE